MQYSNSNLTSSSTEKNHLFLIDFTQHVKIKGHLNLLKFQLNLQTSIVQKKYLFSHTQFLVDMEKNTCIMDSKITWFGDQIWVREQHGHNISALVRSAQSCASTARCSTYSACGKWYCSSPPPPKEGGYCCPRRPRRLPSRTRRW